MGDRWVESEGPGIRRGWRRAGEVDMGCRGKGGGDRRDWARQVMGTGDGDR